MKTIDWLRAQRRGDLVHAWNPIVVERFGRRLEVMVSTDAAKVRGYRENIGARGAQLLADALEAVMPTAVIMAERHRQATVKIAPVLGDILHMTAEQHSDLVDRALYVAQGTDGPWVVSDIGKPWILDRLSAAAVAICEGFFIDGDTPHGIYGYAEAPGVLAVRTPGELTAKHPLIRAGRHDLHQGDGYPDKPTDYSPKFVGVLNACRWLDDGGRPDKLTRIYQDPVDCVVVSPDGDPLPARHPGVELLEESPEWKALLAEDANAAAPDTLPTGAAGGPERLPAVKTPSSVLEVWDDLGAVLPQLSRASKLVLMAHTFGETGGYQADWNHNYGNYKARPGNAETDWQFFACNEYVTAAQIALAQKNAPPRDTLTEEQQAWFAKRTGVLLDLDGPSVVPTKQVSTAAGPMFIVWFFPPHTWSCFAAFKSRRLGLDFYARKMQTRFASCWPSVLRADVVGFSTALHGAGYFTDLPEHYAAGLLRNYPAIDKMVPA